LERLLDDLDLHAKAHEADEAWLSRKSVNRKHARHPFRAECTVRFFPADSDESRSMAARTRNLSRGGLGLIARRVFALGEPVEVELTLPERGMVYMAGLVRFCRYAGLGFHEIGLQLKAVGGAPVIPASGLAARQMIEWLRSEQPVS
jgi:hypothetical protein